MNIEVYSDGSATTVGKPGGWGSVILVDGVVEKELSGHMESATNNDAELRAAIEGLKHVANMTPNSIPAQVYITLISDSEIVLNWANGTYRFKQLEKIAMYNELRDLVKSMNVKTKWVKGHSGNKFNTRCDKLANDARKGLTNKIDKTLPVGDTRIGSKKNGVVSVWYQGILRVIDFDIGIVENYNRELHGKRGSIVEIREGKDR